MLNSRLMKLSAKLDGRALYINPNHIVVITTLNGATNIQTTEVNCLYEIKEDIIQTVEEYNRATAGVKP